MTFAAAASGSRRVAAGLRALGASAHRPVVVVAPNGIARATLTLGAWRAGVPLVALTPADEPGAVRAIAAFVRAAAVLDAADLDALVARPPAADVPLDGDAVAQLVPCGERDGAPLLATTTHANVCAMLEGLSQTWTFLAERPPVIVDRSPWSGFGANVVLGLALRWGGTVFVEPAGGDPELRAEVAPTLAFDVPARWTAWLHRLRADDVLRRRWLARLRLACWSGAPLAAATRDGLRGLGVPLASLWGAATTASAFALSVEREPSPAALGVPLPGVELKLVPRDGVYEARVRGAQVTPGFWWRADATADAFDDEGFLRLGDLVRPLDRGDPGRGLTLAGRTDARFKLGDGAWVDVPALRERFLDVCGDAAEAEIVAAGEDALGVLVTADPGAAIPPALLRAEIAAGMRRLGARRALLVPAHATPSERAVALARLAASEPDAEVIVS